jgi:DNA-binding response OmpR family regulator
VSPVWGEAGNQRSILIIDDDIGLSRMAALVLRRQAFDVDVANSGDDGLALLQAKRYDAIVLDMRMPGKDGRTVFREMRAAGVESPVLVLSAYDARRARDELGSQAFLDKPFEPDILVERINEMIDDPARA